MKAHTPRTPTEPLVMLATGTADQLSSLATTLRDHGAFVDRKHGDPVKDTNTGAYVIHVTRTGTESAIKHAVLNSGMTFRGLGTRADFLANRKLRTVTPEASKPAPGRTRHGGRDTL